MDTVDVLVLHNLTLGKRVLLARVALGWRQIDLASVAQVPAVAVSYAEMDQPIKRWKLQRILDALDLEKKPGEGKFETRMIGP